MAGKSVTLFQNSGNRSNGFLTFYYNKDEYEVRFQGLPENLQESRAASYAEQNVLKRPEPLLVYQWSGFREISFGLTFGGQNSEDAYNLLVLSALIRRSVLPTSKGIPNFVKINLGPWFENWGVEAGYGIGQVTTDDFTSKSGTFAIITNYTLTPSADRITDIDAASKNTLTAPGNVQWWIKAPTTIAVTMQFKVFSGLLWSPGVFAYPSTEAGMSGGTMGSGQAVQPTADSEGPDIQKPATPNVKTNPAETAANLWIKPDDVQWFQQDANEYRFNTKLESEAKVNTVPVVQESVDNKTPVEETANPEG